MRRVSAIGLLALAGVLTACETFDQSPRGCHWLYSRFAMRTDTVHNTIPNTGQAGWVASWVVIHEMPADSQQVCSRYTGE